MTALLSLLPLGDLPAEDRAPEHLAHGSPTELAADLRALLGDSRVLTSVTDLIRYASDASPYRLVPQIVVQPRTAADVAALLRYARENGRTLVFRSGGTSLNGQSVGDDILVDVRRHFAFARPEQDGEVLHVGCGMVIARANASLARYGRKLGPDPASSSAATVGGVIANNASGMQAGTRWNSYETLESLTLVLPSGTIVDTAAADADEHLARDEPELVEGLLALRERILGRPETVARIRQKFSMKNTNGYRLDALLDETSPVQILRRLVVGSQGTLGFVSEARFRTIPVGKHVTTAFVAFEDLHAAAAVVPPLMEAGARTAELLDAQSMIDTSQIAGAPAWQRGITGEQSGVLTDFRTDDPAELDAFEERLRAILEPTMIQGELTRDAKTANGFWAVRSGLLPAVGGNRPKGTAVLVEDVCVPPAAVADAARDLGALLKRHRFPSSVQGHASVGNLHFILLLDPTDPDHLARYQQAMDEVVDLIIDRYDGALKGEHATGRNMAPYVEREWGPELLGYMKELKALIDPSGLLAPGVLFDDDPNANITHLKTMPSVQPELDRCIECGFCEPACPSRDVTTTPRQRIALQREVIRQGRDGAALQALVDQYEHAAVETCAGDSSCAIACPVDIDTGAAMKRIRSASHSPAADALMARAARIWGPLTTGLRWAVAAGGLAQRAVGDAPLRALTRVGRSLLGADVVPAWLGTFPRAAAPLRRAAPLPRMRAGAGPSAAVSGTADDGSPAGAVYFPACINRIFGPPAGAADEVSVVEAMVRLAERAGVPLSMPDGVEGLCCGTVWHSKGFERGHAVMANRLVESLWEASGHGERPVVVDASSCTLGALHEVRPQLTAENARRHGQLRILDALSFAREELLPRLQVTQPYGRVVIHETCSMGHLGLRDDLVAVAGAAAGEVVEPVSTCCGFAGDRGFLHPELTVGATADEARAVAAADGEGPLEAHLSGNRTCELGMEHATGAPYESALVALERATR